MRAPRRRQNLSLPTPRAHDTWRKTLPSPLLTAQLLLAATLAPEAGPPAHPLPDSLPTWSAVILDHVRSYPGLAMDDLYKLLHQGALGAEHAVPDEAAARGWLEREMASLGSPRPDEPLVERIAPGGALVRVHLRPFLAAGGDGEALLQAFLETARRGATSADAQGAELEAALGWALELARRGKLPWRAEALEAHFHALADEGYPARHHSDDYRRLYAPAYRIIAGELAERLLTPTPDPRRRSAPGAPRPERPSPG